MKLLIMLNILPLKNLMAQEFKLTAENFAAKLKQANLVSKNDFDNKLISFNKKIISNKTKYLQIQKYK